jgi:hypothetical protein
MVQGTRRISRQKRCKIMYSLPRSCRATGSTALFPCLGTSWQFSLPPLGSGLAKSSSNLLRFFKFFEVDCCDAPFNGDDQQFRSAQAHIQRGARRPIFFMLCMTESYKKDDKYICFTRCCSYRCFFLHAIHIFICN